MKNKTKELIDWVSFKDFLEKGYEATNIRDICKEVNIKPSSLYFYYKSKEELFFSIYDSIWQRRINSLSEIIDSNEGESPDKILYNIFSETINGTATDLVKHKFLLRYHLFPVDELQITIVSRYKIWSNEEYRLFLKLFLKCIDLNLLNNTVSLRSYYYKYKRFENLHVNEIIMSGILLGKREIDIYWKNLWDIMKENSY